MLGAPPEQAGIARKAGTDTFLVYSQARGLPFLLSSSSRGEHRSALQLEGSPKHLVPIPWGSDSQELLVPRPVSRIVPSCPLLSWGS